MNLEEIMKKLKDNIEYYENLEISNNVYYLSLANGDTISYSISINNIAHLLGINLSNLVNAKIMTKENPITMLKKLSNNYREYLDNINQNTLNKIFSNYMSDKLDIFKLQCFVPYPNKVYFVCKFDGYISDGLDCDYFLARKTTNNDIALLGIKKRKNSYFLATSRLVKSDSSDINKMLKNALINYAKDNNTKNLLEELLTKQVITYVKALTIQQKDRGYRKVMMSLDDAVTIMENLYDLSLTTDSYIDVSCEHINRLNGYLKLKNKNDKLEEKLNNEKQKVLELEEKIKKLTK